MITQDQLENKSIETAPDVDTLRANVSQMRADVAGLEQQLHVAERTIAAADSDVALSQANRDSSALTAGLIARNAAQARVVTAIESLTKARERLNQANMALLHAEGVIAAREAAALEQEIVSELRDFAGSMVRFSQQCERIRDLREKARANQHLITPAVMLALGSSWGEVHSPFTVISRLELLTKAFELPEDVATIVREASRAQSLAERTESDRARQREQEWSRSRRPNANAGPAVEMKFNDEGRLVSRRIND